MGSIHASGVATGDLQLSAPDCIITHRQRVRVMSRQALKDLVGSVAALLSRKALKSDPVGPREDQNPPENARSASRNRDERGSWLLAHEAGGWFVYPPHAAHRPSVSKGEVYVLYFLPEETTEVTGH